MEKLSEIASKAFGKVHSVGGAFVATAATIGAGYELLNGTDASASEIPNVNNEETLVGAKQQISKDKLLNPNKKPSESCLEITSSHDVRIIMLLLLLV